MCLGEIWPEVQKYGQKYRNIDRSTEIWTEVRKYGQKYGNMDRSKQTWTKIWKYGQKDGNMARSTEIWPEVRKYGQGDSITPKKLCLQWYKYHLNKYNYVKKGRSYLSSLNSDCVLKHALRKTCNVILLLQDVGETLYCVGMLCLRVYVR